MNAEGIFEHAVSFERSETRGLAFALGFFFSFRLSIVMISVHLLGVEPGTGSALSLGLDLMLLGVICFSSLGIQQQSVRSALGLPAARWALLYITFAGLSLTWSESASLPHSIAYWLGLVVDVSNVVLLLRGESAQDNAAAMLSGFIWSSCFLALIAWILPGQADLRLGDEQFFNTNEIGSLCAMALFFAQYLTRHNQGTWRFAKFLLFVTLIRSLSKGTIIAFLVSQAFLLIMDRSMRRKTKILLLSSALLLTGVFWGLFEAYYDILHNRRQSGRDVYRTHGNLALCSGRNLRPLLDHLGRPWVRFMVEGRAAVRQRDV